MKTIAEAEGGGYDFMYGAIKGKKNDPWRFTDFSMHPGAGYHGSIAAGMYQITKKTWRDHGVNAMRFTDFAPEIQDSIAIEMLRSIGVIKTTKPVKSQTACLPRLANGQPSRRDPARETTVLPSRILATKISYSYTRASGAL